MNIYIQRSFDEKYQHLQIEVPEKEKKNGQLEQHEVDIELFD